VLATWDIRSGNKHFENDIIFFHCRVKIVVLNPMLQME